MLKRKKLHGKTAFFRCEDRKTDHKNGLSASLLRKRIQEKNMGTTRSKLEQCTQWNHALRQSR